MIDFFQELTVHSAINIYFEMFAKISAEALDVCLRMNYYYYYHTLKSQAADSSGYLSSVERGRIATKMAFSTAKYG